jgi:hypothetical protein
LTKTKLFHLPPNVGLPNAKQISAGNDLPKPSLGTRMKKIASLEALSSGSQVALGNPLDTQVALGAFPMPSTAWRAMTRSQAQLGNEENNP